MSLNSLLFTNLKKIPKHVSNSNQHFHTLQTNLEKVVARFEATTLRNTGSIFDLS